MFQWLCFRKYFAFRMGRTMLQFSQMLLRLSIEPRVFTELTKFLAYLLAEHEANVLMYLDDWLVSVPSPVQLLDAIQMVITTAESMGGLDQSSQVSVDAHTQTIN